MVKYGMIWDGMVWYGMVKYAHLTMFSDDMQHR